MAFAIRNLSVLAYANGFTLWHYKTAVEMRETISLPGFFAAAGDMLTAGDIIMVSAKNGGAMLFVLPQEGCLRTEAL
jgi:hypothetical protein